MNFWDFLAILLIAWFIFQNLEVNVNTSGESMDDGENSTKGWLFLEGLVVHHSLVRHIEEDSEGNAVVHLHPSADGQLVVLKTKTPFDEVYDTFT